MGHFKNLKAWQHARRLALLSRAAIAKLPNSERFALGDQWRRASCSVVLNLAEGAAKKGSREFRRYLDSARASLHEIEAILDLVVGMDYLPAAEVDAIEAVRAECARTVYGLLRRFDPPTART